MSRVLLEVAGLCVAGDPGGHHVASRGFRSVSGVVTGSPCPPGPSSLPARPLPPAVCGATSSASPRPGRDANQVRSVISSFQSGTSRGRQLADGGTDVAPQTAGGNGLVGSEEGPGGHGEPVTTPDTDLNPRDATW